MSVCRKCGASILWIGTKGGKWMPVDTNPVLIRTDTGTDKFLDDEGNVITGARVDTRDEADDAVFVPHWATCPYADDFRKRGPKS